MEKVENGEIKLNLLMLEAISCCLNIKLKLMSL